MMTTKNWFEERWNVKERYLKATPTRYSINENEGRNITQCVIKFEFNFLYVLGTHSEATEPIQRNMTLKMKKSKIMLTDTIAGK